jgi:hypothetical protein
MIVRQTATVFLQGDSRALAEVPHRCKISRGKNTTAFMPNQGEQAALVAGYQEISPPCISHSKQKVIVGVGRAVDYRKAIDKRG